MNSKSPEIRRLTGAEGKRLFLKAAVLTLAGGYGGFKLADWLRSQQPHEQREVDVVNSNMRVISIAHNLSFQGNKGTRCDGYEVRIELADAALSDIQTMKVTLFDGHMNPIPDKEFFVPGRFLEGRRDERNMRMSDNPDEYSRMNTASLREVGVDPSRIEFPTFVQSREPVNIILEIRSYARDLETVKAGESFQELDAYYFRKFFPVTCAPVNAVE